MTTLPHPSESAESRPLSNVSYDAYRLLQFAFVIAPILAGIDKYTRVMVDWDKYLAPWANRLVGGHGHAFMLVVGIVEIVAGIGVALKPSVFGYIVGAWLLCIIINLLSMGMYFDIALRDVGLMLAAVAMARLAMMYDHGWAGGLMKHHKM